MQHSAIAIPDDNDIDIWFFRLNRADRSLLSYEERDRSCRIRSFKARQDFVAARTAVRTILSRYLGVQPQTVDIVVNDAGRPSLACGALSFNHTRSGDFGALAVARGCALGVDLESTTVNADLFSVSREHFSVAEQHSMAGLNDIAWFDAFYQRWTAKEAVVKALGRGIRGPLSTIEIDVKDPGAPVWRSGSLTLRSMAVRADLRLSVATGLTAPNLHIRDVADARDITQPGAAA
ncbi:MAG: 4'-phosphopantetheinyl transferase superfamily protein [Pseudomonadota bacterium]